MTSGVGKAASLAQFLSQELIHQSDLALDHFNRRVIDPGVLAELGVIGRLSGLAQLVQAPLVSVGVEDVGL
jgi:hypothetical protein